MSSKQWVCSSCQQGAGPRSGKAQRCDPCRDARRLYATTVRNLKSGFNRKKVAPTMDMTIEQFCAWRRGQTLICYYCGLAEADIPKVGMKSQIQKHVRVLGVDRRNSSIGYQASNLVPCCFVCNQIKGDRMTDAEMHIVGKAIGQVWQSRLAAAKELNKVQQSTSAPSGARG
jgi:hypothetical protein